MASTWEHKKMTEDELKELVRDVYDQKIFTSLHCGAGDTRMVFMPLMFIGSPPSEPSPTNNIKIDRRNKLNYIQEKLDYEQETPVREEFLKNIGMVYEFYSQAGPRSINGYPIFMSFKIVSIDDTNKFIEKYNKYVKMRENFEKEWK